MNPTYHRPTCIEIHRANWSGDTTESFFNLRLRYHEAGDWQYLINVHVPPELAVFFEADTVAGFHLETLDMQGVARVLPGCPRAVVIALHSVTGEQHICVPNALRRHFQKRAACAVLAVALAAASYGALPFISGTLLATGIGLLATVHKRLPVPFKVVREVG